MNTDHLINEFERKMIVQRYSPNSIQNYKSAVRGFLQLGEKKYSHPLEITETEIEKYLFWKIEKHHIGTSYQRLIVTLDIPVMLTPRSGDIDPS
jgi:site-specific recombinase XerD